MSYEHIRVTPLATPVGAEICGVDLAAPPRKPGVAEIRRALGEYGVVFFRDQTFDAGAASRLRALFWRDRHQPLLCRCAGLSDDRGGAQRNQSGSAISIMIGIPTILMTRRRHWGRCSMRTRCRGPATTHCSPACMRPTMRCQMV